MRIKGNFFSLLALLIFASVASAAAAPPKRPTPPPPTCSAWSYDFNVWPLDSTKWVVATGQAPGYIAGVHRGTYDLTNVSVSNGWLKLKLDQSSGYVDGKLGVISSGAMVYSVAQCGYGTYEWRMKMSSTATDPSLTGFPISGSVSAGFSYVNNSQTEVDFEFSALTTRLLWMVNWFNTNPRTAPTSNEGTATYLDKFDPWDAIHIYKYVWAPGSIAYYVDGAWRSTHTTDIPSAAAYIMINHWGTNSSGWGGPATLNTPRYFYIDRFSYTPPQ